MKLEKNEGILLIATEVWRYFNDNELVVDTLYLTNQNLISVYEKSKGIFSKRKTFIDKVPLTSISIINDVVQVKKVIDDNYGESLQIIFNDGKKELLEFTESPKKEYQQWKVAISNAVLECNDKRTSDNQDKTIVRNSPVAEINEAVNLNKSETRFCSFCGTKLDPGARFCKSCGKPVEVVCKSVSEEVDSNAFENENFSQEAITKRKIVYEGSLHKCPNCGEVLNSFIITCPSCGYELRSVNPNNALKELSAKLEAIDIQSDDSFKKLLKKHSKSTELTEKEKQKIALIRNFPIPNTKEDLYEFLIMAVSNIDTEHIEGWNSSEQSEGEKALSEAWKAKYEQAYHKANISFGNSQEFQELNKTYLNKIQRHEHKKNIFNIGLAIFFAIYIVICILCLLYMERDSTTRQQAVDAENERLELILDDIQKYIAEEDYTKARALNATLVFNASVNLRSSIDAKEHWDDIRKEIYDLIEQAEEKDSDDLEGK